MTDVPYSQKIVAPALTVYSAQFAVRYVGPFSPGGDLSPGLVFVEWMPLWAYAILWGVAAVLSVASYFDRRFIAPCFGLVVALTCLWGMSFSLADVFTDANRGWVSASNYFLIAVLLSVITLTRERTPKSR